MRKCSFGCMWGVKEGLLIIYSSSCWVLGLGKKKVLFVESFDGWAICPPNFLLSVRLIGVKNSSKFNNLIFLPMLVVQTFTF